MHEYARPLRLQAVQAVEALRLMLAAAPVVC